MQALEDLLAHDLQAFQSLVGVAPERLAGRAQLGLQSFQGGPCVVQTLDDDEVLLQVLHQLRFRAAGRPRTILWRGFPHVHNDCGTRALDILLVGFQQRQAIGHRVVDLFQVVLDFSNGTIRLLREDARRYFFVSPELHDGHM